MTESNIKEFLESGVRTLEKIDLSMREITGKKIVLPESTDENCVEIKKCLRSNNQDILNTISSNLPDDLKARQVKLLEQDRKQKLIELGLRGEGLFNSTSGNSLVQKDNRSMIKSQSQSAMQEAVSDPHTLPAFRPKVIKNRTELGTSLMPGQLSAGNDSPIIESSTAVQDFETTRDKKHARFGSAASDISATINQPNTYSPNAGLSKNSGFDLNNPGSSSKDTSRTGKLKRFLRKKDDD